MAWGQCRTLCLSQNRRMSVGLQIRFLRATAFPISTYGCESCNKKSSDKKSVDAFELWCYKAQCIMDGEEDNQLGVRQDCVCLLLRMRFFGHVVRQNSIEKRLIQGKG